METSPGRSRASLHPDLQSLPPDAKAVPDSLSRGADFPPLFRLVPGEHFFMDGKYCAICALQHATSGCPYCKASPGLYPELEDLGRASH
jgi:hypothetical protein